MVLRPGEPLTGMVSKQWQDVGFQGCNPSTDFRGMGLLGLAQLVYFCETLPEQSKRVYARSLHPTKGYPFAIAGINLTSLACNLLNSGHLKVHMYSVTASSATMRHFHEAYCSIYCLFDELWFKEDPESVMAFNQVLSKLKAQLTRFLESSEAAVLPFYSDEMVPPTNSDAQV